MIANAKQSMDDFNEQNKITELALEGAEAVMEGADRRLVQPITKLVTPVAETLAEATKRLVGEFVIPKAQEGLALPVQGADFVLTGVQQILSATAAAGSDEEAGAWRAGTASAAQYVIDQLGDREVRDA